MKNNKKLTLGIVIPVFNEQSHIKSCLEAIANQSEMPEEVVVVDNNSSDKTVEIVEQFDKIEQAGGTVSLAIGLRQPRWPECHGPEWAMIKTVPEWTDDLLDYTAETIDRYRNRPSLVSYQLENEYFLDVFGHCPDHSRDRLVREFDFVKNLDPDKPLIVSRSNNATPSWPLGEPRADIVAASIYKRVWDKTITKRYFEYPLPAWFYGFLAGATELTTGRNTVIHELQTEAWLPENKSMKTEPIEELYKTMNPDRLVNRIKYAEDTGMKSYDLWGGGVVVSTKGQPQQPRTMGYR